MKHTRAGLTKRERIKVSISPSPSPGLSQNRHVWTKSQTHCSSQGDPAQRQRDTTIDYLQKTTAVREKHLPGTQERSFYPEHNKERRRPAHTAKW